MEVRRFGANPYLGAATPQTFEVRVPAERLAEAHTLINSIDSTPALSDAAAADTAAPPAEKSPAAESKDPHDTPPAERVPRLWMVVPLGIVAIVPVGCLYARWPRLGYLLLSAGTAGLLAGIAAGQPRALALFALAKAVDQVPAPP